MFLCLHVRMPKVFTTLIFKDWLSRALLIASLALNLAVWAFLYLKFFPLRTAEGVLPLHYNIYFGIDFVGAWYEILIIPLVGIFFIIVNFILADIIYLRDKVAGYFLIGAAALSQILLLLAAYAIIMINE